MSFANKAYIRRSIERLYGIVQGINVDGCINDREIKALNSWIDSHATLHAVEPFRDLVCLVSDILEDGIIDSIEKEALSKWYSDFAAGEGFMVCVTRATRQLHGIMSGIVCDGEILVEELTGLQKWLVDYEYMGDWWPFNELKKLLDAILADGKIDVEERETLEQFFLSFTEQIIDDPVILDDEYWLNRHMINLSPVFKPIATICEKNPNIRFENKTFCFTGPAATGKRKDLFLIVQENGGIPKKNPVIDLDYLVIGAQASPAWVYSTYGRKIEAVLNRKNDSNYCQTCIVYEVDFIEALQKR